MSEEAVASPVASKPRATTVGELMSPPVGVFRRDMTVAETIESLREMTRAAFITYGYVTDEDGRLEGVVVMRDLLLATPQTKLGDIMLKDVFSLRETTPMPEALKAALSKHYPVYPICDAEGRLKGLVRGDTLFAEQVVEISAQAGSMVGVEKEERLATPIPRSLKLRHPWLQINLLTAFLAAAVVGCFEDTINHFVILAVFLPVMAGQSGNTGCQALAMALRGMTLGDVKKGKERTLILKEATLGFANGLLVGITAGIGMFIYATMQKNGHPLLMGGIVMMAMTASCVISGLSGALIPLALKRLGADPATASSIFLTTATDIASMGIFLSLAKALVPVGGA
ncbi:MAG: magnesium transporter [Luteolibacter sp.]